MSTHNRFKNCCGKQPAYKTSGGYAIVYCKKCGRIAEHRKATAVRSVWNFLLNSGLKKRTKTLEEKNWEKGGKGIIVERTEAEKIMEEFKKKDKEVYLKSQEVVE